MTARPSAAAARILIGLGLSVAAAVALVGPWPTRGPLDLARHEPTLRARAALATSAARSTTPPGRLSAGWARRVPELPPGVPLAGYSARQGRASTGSLDPIDVEALVVSDGRDHAAIVASDLLIVPPGVARRVRAAVAARTPLTPDDLLLNASHTHSGPGAFAPGWLAEQSAGSFDPRVEEALVEAFARTVESAWQALEPASIGHARRLVPEWIHNRTRPGAAVDAELQVLAVTQDDGDRLLVACYAAHPTLLPASNSRLSADYPGFLERRLEEATGAEVFFVSGAVGSMGPGPPDAGPASPAPSEQARVMGEALAAHAVAAVAEISPTTRVEVATAATSYRMPVLQVRLGRRLRWSPFLVRQLGVDDEAWLSAVRIGDLVLIGAPGDLSGEISIGLKREARQRRLELWTTSFNGAYLGYISPDRYYESASRSGREGYEMYTMSWGGPQQEAQLISLVEAAIEGLAPPRPDAGADRRGRPSATWRVAGRLR